MTTKLFSPRIKRIKKWVRKRKAVSALLAVLLVGLIFAYAEYMNNRRLSVDPSSYGSLLGLIGKVESNGNYNAHFGNANNRDVRFTEMSIDEVLKWQAEFVANGSPSSAVGKYQILNTTLKSLVRDLNLDTSETFDEKMQDKLGTALLERRGSIAYVNEEISKEEFAASLAKEWAALPKVVGDNPESSYYDGDGLNKSRVKTDEVLKAIDPISPV